MPYSGDYSEVSHRILAQGWYRKATDCTTADRANITGKFVDAECQKLEAAFLHFIRQMELMLSTGELNPRHAHCVTLYHNDLTCEADTLGSYGYVYIVIYPTQR